MTTAGAVRAGSERRDEILAIAAQLFAERGFAATTVREIADAAGILSGSLYHHFDSKESMVDELVHEMLDRVLAAYRRIIATDAGPGGGAARAGARSVRRDRAPMPRRSR